MCASFCGVLKTQWRLLSTGSTMRSDEAMAIIGVSDSAAMSIIARLLGVTEEPRITSTLSSDVNLRVFLTAATGSDASSSTMYSTFLPAISRGMMAKTFFSGMPSDAAGPVAEIVTPTLICACAASGTAARVKAEASSNFLNMVSPVDLLLCTI